MLRLHLILLLLLTLSPNLHAWQDASQTQTPANDRRVVLVTLDGLRWQELFLGADRRLMNKDAGGVDDPELLEQTYWRSSPEQRRETLMPFMWSTIAAEGQIWGDPELNSHVLVTNQHEFSYPGYNEILSGFPDPRIDSNSKTPNPNVTVLEWLHRQSEFAGSVHAFASWDVFPYIINTERSGIPVNAGWQSFERMHDTREQAHLNALTEELPRYWASVRYDAITFRSAMDCLAHKQPRVLYLSLGETDDWAHSGRYDLYLHAARQADQYLRKLWDTIQSTDGFRDRTTLLITTDHGRGDGRESWKSHSTSIPGCNRIWMAAIGPQVPALGVRTNNQGTQSQMAASVAEAVGLDFTEHDKRVASPFDFNQNEDQR